jgi:hypothetical protein
METDFLKRTFDLGSRTLAQQRPQASIELGQSPRPFESSIGIQVQMPRKRSHWVWFRL